MLWRSVSQNARMSEIKNGGLDQYGAELLEQQQFEPAGTEGVNYNQRSVFATTVKNWPVKPTKTAVYKDAQKHQNCFI